MTTTPTGRLYGQLNPWTDDDLGRIHRTSLQILERIGVQVQHDDVLEILEATDAKVDRDRRVVRFPADMVEDRMRNAPGSWDRVKKGISPISRDQPSMDAFFPGVGQKLDLSPFSRFSVSVDSGGEKIWDYRTRRPRSSTPRDLVDVPRLVQAMENIDEAGNLVRFAAIPPNVEDLVLYRHMWNHTEKTGGGGLGRCPACVFGLSSRTVDYLCQMLKIKVGGDPSERDPELSFFMGVASPLRFGHDVLDMALYMLRLGQAVGIGGNCVSGIQAPITPASDIAVDHAERLAGLCIVTSIRSDARFYFCNHAYSLDMQGGDVAHGSPEMTLQALLGQKLLNYCGFQLVVNHPILDTSAHTPDAQAAAEKMMYMLLTALGGAKGIGGAGGLKEYLCYEQIVIDNEIAGYVRQLLKGAVVNDETLALGEIEQHGIGGNFLTSETTMKFLRECYYAPRLFYRKRVSEWLGDGGKDTLERAHEKVESILARETPRFLTDDQLGAIDEIIRRACRELAPDWDPNPLLDL
jgi:trimethylamine--corrinoid protein Co-methyltransferase